MIDTIVLDLDDVLNAFTMHVLGQLGIDVKPYDFDRYPVKCGFDIIAAWVELTGNEEPSVPQFWEWVTRDMWACAPKSEQWWIIDACAEAVGRENVMVATSPTKSADCLAGKYDWIMRHLPVWLQRQYNITPRKHKLAQHGYLLIDDSSANCEKFINKPDGTPTGASALTMPRPWNHLNHLVHDCDNHISRELQAYFPNNVF